MPEVQTLLEENELAQTNLPTTQRAVAESKHLINRPMRVALASFAGQVLRKSSWITYSGDAD
jgi:hypothetical protein